MRTLAFASLIATACPLSATPPPPSVTPALETDARPDPADGVRAVALWVHPREPAASLLLATHARSGVVAYDLGGHASHTLALDGADLITSAPLSARELLVLVSRENSPSIAGAELPAPGYRLKMAVAELIKVDGPRVTALGAGGAGGSIACFAAAPGGIIEHHRITRHEGKTTSARLRTWTHAAEVSALLVDAGGGWLYVADTEGSLWRLGITAESPTQGAQVERRIPGTMPDVYIHALSLLEYPDGGGYILASFRESGSVVIYERKATNSRLGVVRLQGAAGIDRVEFPGAVASNEASFGAAFPFGLLAVQDAKNDDASPNLKVVGWDAVARAVRPPLPLPRQKSPSR